MDGGYVILVCGTCMTISRKDLPKVQGRYEFGASLSQYSWFGVGGRAECLFIPKNVDDLLHFLRNKAQSIPVFVLGAGSNVLIRDGGIDGVVIKLCMGFNQVTQVDDKPIISAGAGAMDSKVSNTALKKCIGGFEFLSSIPGTIGGAIAMNAGAYGRDMSDALVSAEYVTSTGEALTIKAQNMLYHYRGNDTQQDMIFVSALIKGEFCEEEEILNKIKVMRTQRKNTQPINSKTCGSTFKNPEHHKAWHLIEESGCSGLRVGGAVVSDMHCNFIINDNNATADDIETLIELIKERVHKHTSITLEEEIKIIGKKKEEKEDYEYMYIV